MSCFLLNFPAQHRFGLWHIEFSQVHNESLFFSDEVLQVGSDNNECIKACCVLGLVWLRLSFSCRSKGWSSKELILQVNSILTDVGLYFSAIKGASTCAIYSKKQRNLA